VAIKQPPPPLVPPPPELFDTVTGTSLLAVVFPAVSLAVAVKVCEPFAAVVVFQERL
jgi:hypothetical protein